MKFALYNLQTKELKYYEEYDNAFNAYVSQLLTTNNRYEFLKDIRIAWIENDQIVQLDYVELKSNTKVIPLKGN